MRTATVAELHEKLDEVLDAVRAGEAVEIRDDNGQIARLIPPSTLVVPPHVTGEARIQALIAAGVLRRGGDGSGKLPDDFLTEPLPQFSSGSVLEALLQEREEGWCIRHIDPPILIYICDSARIVRRIILRAIQTVLKRDEICDVNELAAILIEVGATKRSQE